MTWWWRLCRATFTRWDEWWEGRGEKTETNEPEDDDRLIDLWFGEQRMPAFHDTGTIVATPEDLAEIGPFDPVKMPGQRRPKHARPKGES